MVLEAGDLFDELKKCVKQKIMMLAQEKPDPAGIAEALGLPLKTVLTLIGMMAQEGTIRIVRVEQNNK